MSKIFNHKIVYPVITFLFISMIGLLFFYVARFFLNEISGAFEIDQVKIEANLSKVDTEKYRSIAPRLSIDPTKPN